MATTRWSFVHNDRSFTFDLVTHLSPDEFLWQATIWCDFQEIGRLHGAIAKHAIPPDRWKQSVLKETAVVEIQDAIMGRKGLAW